MSFYSPGYVGNIQFLDKKTKTPWKMVDSLPGAKLGQDKPGTYFVSEGSIEDCADRVKSTARAEKLSSL